MSAEISSSVVAEPVQGSLSFLANLRQSGVLSGTQLRRVLDLVRSGQYPRESFALARMLVRKRILTEYQARCLLHHKRPSLVIGRYVILKRLGSGSMGRVYLARHRLMGRIVALKVVNRDVASPGPALARFRREMLLVGMLDHPNVIRSFDADRVNGVPYIVMEYLPGRGLDRMLLEEGPLPPDRVANYAAQAADALAHAHKQGVIHRDVKLSNLMVDDEGRLKLLDFGVGALTSLHAAGAGDKLTADGLAIGTVEYMSPEQACGRPLDGRSDLYSLGCVMYHLLTGHVPFPADSKIASMAMRVHVSPFPIALRCPDLPAGLVAVVERLMAQQPGDRYATAEEAASALRLVLQTQPALSTTSTVAVSERFPETVGQSSPVRAWCGRAARFVACLSSLVGLVQASGVES